MKQALALFFGVILGAILVIGGYFHLTSSKHGDDILKLTFTEAEVQARIAKKFPKKEKILHYIPVVIEEPIVKFLGESKRIQVSAKATIAIPLVGSEELLMVCTSSIRYEKEDKTLRISDLTVERIETHRLPKKYEDAVRLALTTAARKQLNDHIIHTIKAKDIPRAMAEMLVQKIKVKHGRLEITLGL